jgi:hypothetical protein
MYRFRSSDHRPFKRNDRNNADGRILGWGEWNLVLEAVDEAYLAPEVAALPLLMGADGVMARFRPKLGTPEGKTVWREVKVAILARLGKRITRTGEQTPRLMQRRLVAVLGSTERLSRRMLLEALRQGIRTAKRVVWLSDGGRGFWTVYTERFSRYALGILDF